MTSCPKSLLKTQEWFAKIITTPLCADQTLPTVLPWGTSIVDEAPQKIAPSPTLKPHERLEIYAQQYWWRLIRILQENFPLVTRLMGYETFNNDVAIPYLDACPSNHWALCRLGDALPKWISNHYAGEDRTLLCHSASIDFAAQRAFWSGAFLSLTSEDDPEKIFQTPLRLQPTLSLFSLPYDLFSLRDKLLQNEEEVGLEPPPLKKEPCFFIVYRNGKNHVCWKSISQAEHRLLTLFSEGHSPKRACDTLEKEGGEPYQLATELLPLWFKQWIQLGWLTESPS